MVSGPAASASLKNWLEMGILVPHLDLLIGNLGWVPIICAFSMTAGDSHIAPGWETLP